MKQQHYKGVSEFHRMKLEKKKKPLLIIQIIFNQKIIACNYKSTPSYKSKERKIYKISFK